MARIIEMGISPYIKEAKLLKSKFHQRLSKLFAQHEASHLYKQELYSDWGELLNGKLTLSEMQEIVSWFENTSVSLFFT